MDWDFFSTLGIFGVLGLPLCDAGKCAEAYRRPLPDLGAVRPEGMGQREALKGVQYWSGFGGGTASSWRMTRFPRSSQDSLH